MDVAQAVGRSGPVKPENAAGKRVLEPSERVAEVLFGLIMVLTFTGSLSVADAGRDDVREMLVGAVGCNIAWGIIDGVLYLMGSLAARGQGLMALKAVRGANDAGSAHRAITGALPPLVASVMTEVELEAIRQRLIRLPEPPSKARVTKRDLLGALGVFLWVFLCTFPVVLPFVFMAEVQPAMRVSNGVAVVMLFLTGFAFGRCAGRNPWLTGLAMFVLGMVLVGMTIALGG